MARTLYGPEVIAVVTTDDGDLGPATAPMSVWSAFSGGSQVTDLQDANGSAVTQVTPDVGGRVVFYGPDGTTTLLWVQDPAGNRWAIRPALPTTVGLPGSNGASAYEIAVANGYSGTQAQWLASLQGAPGTGTNGTNGSVWRFGTGAPAGSLGALTDVYTDTVNGDTYSKTGATTWAKVMKLMVIHEYANQASAQAGLTAGEIGVNSYFVAGP